MKIKVENMVSTNGNYVPNQFIITTENETIFQSYDSVIAIKDNDGKIKLDAKLWDYSRTTGKYRNAFLGEYIAETRKKIENGDYVLEDLN